MTYTARQLATWDTQALLALPEQVFEVKFDDGIAQIQRRELIYGAICWRMYNVLPPCPTSIRHSVNGREISTMLHATIMGEILWDAVDHNPTVEVDWDRATRELYASTNEIYNALIQEAAAHVETINAEHFIDIMLEPSIAKARAEVKPTTLSIDTLYATVQSTMRESPALRNNPVVRSVMTGMLDSSQVAQCVGARGFMTDIDGHIFRDPVISSYAGGVMTALQSLIDSRSASVAALTNGTPLRKTETFNRRIQLLAGVMGTFSMHDCRSPHHLKWMVGSGDLKHLNGMYYQNEQGGYSRVTLKSAELVGKTINVRTVLTCMSPDPTRPCEMCFGELASSIPKGTSVGHASSVALCMPATQGALSTKHLIRSAHASTIQFSEEELRYVRHSTDGMSVLLNPRLKGKKLWLEIAASEAQNIGNVKYVSGVRELRLESTSQITTIGLTSIDASGMESRVDILVTDTTARASISYEMLEHIQRAGFTVSPRGNFQIPLDDWDYNAPVLVLPAKHISMVEQMLTIVGFFGSTRKAGKKVLADSKSPEEALRALHAVVNARLSVNLAYLALLIKCCMARNPADGDYRIPHYGNAVHFITMDTAIYRRSMAAMMAYQRHSYQLKDPVQFLLRNRPDHLLDPILM